MSEDHLTAINADECVTGDYGKAKSCASGLAVQLADLKSGRATAFVYLHSAFDWEPLFRFSHLCSLFIFVDPRFSREQFNDAFNLIREGQTKVGAGLAGLPSCDPDYTATLARDILPAAVQENLDWLWAGTETVNPWVTAKALDRKIGQQVRRLWLIYIGGSPLVAYQRLFADRQLAPRCLCLREYADMDTPDAAEATIQERSAEWTKAVLWDGPLGQMIRDQRAPLPEYLVGDGHEFDWPHTDIRQLVADWQRDFGTTVRQVSGARWPDFQPADEQGARRVVVTLKPLNPQTAKDVDAIVVSPAFFLRYQWPEHLTVILKRPPQGAYEILPDNARIVVCDLAGKPLAEGLRQIDQVARERSLWRVAVNRLGFEDEGIYLSEWRQTDGAIKELTIHAIDDGTFLDMAPYVDCQD